MYSYFRMNVKSTEPNVKYLGKVFMAHVVCKEIDLQAVYIDSSYGWQCQETQCHILLLALKHLSFYQNLLYVALFSFHGTLSL